MWLAAFLWVSVTYLVSTPETESTPTAATPDHMPTVDVSHPQGLQIPCERDGTRVFISSADVAFVRADGHYTQVFTKEARHFCAWSITEANKRLIPQGFIRVHRSYVVNPLRVANFERSKDRGACHFDGAHLPPAPVSRANLRDVQDRLAANAGAVRAV